MPRQNRVTPWGEIIATPARGTLFGNRGCLHDKGEEIKRLYQVKRWIYCQLTLRPGRSPRPPMPPGFYTGLFFLDEATALAAGHRPCAECKRPRFNEFVSAWRQANPDLTPADPLRVDALDTILHRERFANKQKVTYEAPLQELPPGVFISFRDEPQPYLLLAETLRPWQPEGYGPALPRPVDLTVRVLTPRSVVKAIAVGFQPDLHPSGY